MKTQSMSHPWQEMRRLQREMEHLGGYAPAGRWSLTGEYPPLNLTRDDKGLTLEVLCPGVDRSSFDVSIVGDAVTIRGERKPEANVAEERNYRRERPIGTFTRTIYETDKSYVLLADMPGVPPDGLDVVAERDELIVRGRVEQPATAPDYQEFELANYYRAVLLIALGVRLRGLSIEPPRAVAHAR